MMAAIKKWAIHTVNLARNSRLRREEQDKLISTFLKILHPNKFPQVGQLSLKQHAGSMWREGSGQSPQGIYSGRQPTLRMEYGQPSTMDLCYAHPSYHTEPRRRPDRARPPQGASCQRNRNTTIPCTHAIPTNTVAAHSLQTATTWSTPITWLITHSQDHTLNPRMPLHP